MCFLLHLRYGRGFNFLKHDKQEGFFMAKYNRNSGKEWTTDEIKKLKDLARHNTPTGVIGLKLGRTKSAVRTRASEENISLKPTNQSPYNRSK